MKGIITSVSSVAAIIIIAGVYTGKILWVFIGVAFLILLFLFIYFKGRSLALRADSEFYSEIDKIRKTGERIPLDFDSCDIKERSYSEDIIDERMTRFSHLNLDYGKVIGQEHIGQSLLIYNHSGDNGPEKFIQAFPYGAETLKVKVIQNLITLYIDRSDRTKYYFDLKSD